MRGLTSLIVRCEVAAEIIIPPIKTNFQITSMNQLNLSDEIVSCEYFADDFLRGFLGSHGEGCEVLKGMGLPYREAPFDVEPFLSSRVAIWPDGDGVMNSVSFNVTPTQLNCTATRGKSSKSVRMCREWGMYEDKEMIAHLESEAIGELCMKCLIDMK